jgi:RecA/RadA recombinase
MPGAILGIYGKQRSGKTLIAYKIAQSLQNKCKDAGYDLRVYTNLYTTDSGFTYVRSIDELPLDLSPKIVLLDEVYNGLDAQDYRKLKNISIFLNTIGKQNCLLIFTSIDANMVYNRLRTQSNAVILAKGDKKRIHYKFINLNTMHANDFVCIKNDELFKNVNYDTQFIPVEFNWDMTTWIDKLNYFYKENYGFEL